MVTVFGSINLDVSVPTKHLPNVGETVMGGAALISPGGKGANQAHAARLFDVPTRLFGVVGQDAFAEPALASLSNIGVDITGITSTASQRTGLAVITVNENGDNSIVVSAGANLEAYSAMVSDHILDETRVLLLQLEVPAAESFRLAHRARQRGCKVILNVSPISDAVDIDFSAIDILIVNEIEIEQISRRLGITATDSVGLAVAVSQAHNVDVLVTMGENGSVLSQTDDRLFVTPTMQVTPIDTTGAGDTYTGVFAAALASGSSAVQAMSSASVAASLVCTRLGAQAAQFSREEIEKHLISEAHTTEFAAGYADNYITGCA
ncbi:ribokinase [Undibacterium sp. SXout7W]|uniref:ribokinase n=1 Tax=Undibacterium sp. SXout7W TaxID=3413049 RepID=UPI003BEF5464